MTTDGSCLCGAVTWEVSGEPNTAYHCHCKICRKVHGAAFATYWFMTPSGMFGTHMDVALVNDGPTTVILKS